MKTAIQFLHKTLWLMIIYYQTKFGSKRIRSSEDIVETVIFWSLWALVVTLTLKTANQSFWKTICSQWCITIPSLIVKGLTIKKISSGQTFINILNFAITLTLNTIIQFLHKTFWLMIMHYQTKFGSKRISSSEDIAECHILILWALAVTFTLKIAYQSLACTLAHNDASLYQVWWQYNGQLLR